MPTKMKTTIEVNRSPDKQWDFGLPVLDHLLTIIEIILFVLDIFIQNFAAFGFRDARILGEPSEAETSGISTSGI
ncbi:hypothetical protein QVD17_28520 [Tagetes erecta]|uniref:Uncharacterized protein n=1 Tax=Tagetes erecta TaxID=13708 RepID=A0AAD8KAT0_TARER|nr:hypothetical protein QVD17_28520 [Tagetes erecta]